MKLLLLIPLLALTGCVSMSKLAEQLKQDPATVDIDVSTIYGQFRFHRAFPVSVATNSPINPVIAVPMRLEMEVGPKVLPAGGP